MTLSKSCATVLICLFACLGGCNERDATLQISNARIVLPPPGMGMAAGYFEISNPGRSPLRLRSVSSAVFSSVEMHETLSENGLSQMREMKEAEVPPGGSLRFEPGGKHLMLMGGPGSPVAEEAYTMTLDIVDANGSTQRVEARFKVEHAGNTHAH